MINLEEIKNIIKNTNSILNEYEQLNIDWLKTGNNIPTEKDMSLVHRKLFLELMFNELGIKYKKWDF